MKILTDADVRIKPLTCDQCKTAVERVVVLEPRALGDPGFKLCTACAYMLWSELIRAPYETPSQDTQHSC